MPENPDKRDYDVFISYRRESGGTVAQALRANLRLRQLRVFLDVSDLKRGRFDETLLQRIAETPNFIVILSPNSLDRCRDQGDWLRQEIVQALNTGSNIIPILMPKFEFPQDLPEEMRTLPRQQAVKYDHEYFEDMVERIFLRVEEERAEAERESRNRAEQERIAREQAERESRERAAVERRAAEQAEAERAAMLKAEEERKSQLVSQLTKAAQEAQRRGNLPAARNHLVEVLQINSHNIEVKSLLAQVEAELASHQKKLSDLFEQANTLAQQTGATGLGTLLERARALAGENRREEARHILTQKLGKRHRNSAVQKVLREIHEELSRFQKAGEIEELLSEVAGFFETDALEQATQVLRKASQKYRDPDVSNVLRWANSLRQEPEPSRVCLNRAAALILKKTFVDARTVLIEASAEVQGRPFYKELFQIVVENEGSVSEAQTVMAVLPPEDLHGARTPESETEPMGIAPNSVQPTTLSSPEQLLSGAEAGKETELVHAASRSPSDGTPLATAEPARQPALVTLPALPRQESQSVAAARGVLEKPPVPLRLPNSWLLAVGIAVIVVALGVWLISKPNPQGTYGASPGALEGAVSLDVSPWAEVKEVRNMQTQKLENFSGQTTPLKLSLPAGDYQVVLAHPSLGNTKLALHVNAGSQQQIRQSFPGFDPDQVLKAYR